MSYQQDFLRAAQNSCTVEKYCAENVYVQTLLDFLNKPFQCENHLYTSESDVYRRLILSIKMIPVLKEIKYIDYILVVDPQNKHSIELERTD